MSDTDQPRASDILIACSSCRSGFHDECTVGFAGDLEDGQACCCNGEYTLSAHYALMVAEERLRTYNDHADAGAGYGPPVPPRTLEKPRGNSGYIHPDAWPSTRDIGTLVDPESTGRKRVVEFYPIEAGMVCEWARLKHAGGGVAPIIGCMGNPATDQHHGPDKNTLNNVKGSRGVGVGENVHLICADCHNAWHAANDEFYPPYDRVADQALPWLPATPQEWGPQNDTTEATFEELIAVEKQREERRKKRGRKNRGRNTGARTEPDLTVRDDE